MTTVSGAALFSKIKDREGLESLPLCYEPVVLCLPVSLQALQLPLRWFLGLEQCSLSMQGKLFFGSFSDFLRLNSSQSYYLFCVQECHDRLPHFSSSTYWREEDGIVLSWVPWSIQHFCAKGLRSCCILVVLFCLVWLWTDCIWLRRSLRKASNLYWR